jgi:hypothetical protein
MSGLGEWDDADTPPEIDQAAAPELVYPNLETFFSAFLAPTYRRSLAGGRTWCPQWWRHAEAIARLDVLWQSWEQMRLEGPAALSAWWRDHADHHMAVLLDPDGPFKGCKPSKHRDENLDPLPFDRSPDGRVTLR